MDILMQRLSCISMHIYLNIVGYSFVIFHFVALSDSMIGECPHYSKTSNCFGQMWSHSYDDHVLFLNFTSHFSRGKAQLPGWEWIWHACAAFSCSSQHTSSDLLSDRLSLDPMLLPYDILGNAFGQQSLFYIRFLVNILVFEHPP